MSGTSLSSLCGIAVLILITYDCGGIGCDRIGESEISSVGGQSLDSLGLLQEKIGNMLNANASNVLIGVGEPLQIGLPQLSVLLCEEARVLLGEHLGHELGVLASLLDVTALQLVLDLRHDQVE